MAFTERLVIEPPAGLSDQGQFLGERDLIEVRMLSRELGDVHRVKRPTAARIVS